MWRLALSSYLWVALQKRALASNLNTELLKKALKAQYKREWVIYVSPVMSKAKFLRYAGRYIRRPALPLSHILDITDQGVRFLAKDTRAKRMVEARVAQRNARRYTWRTFSRSLQARDAIFRITVPPTEKSNVCDCILPVETGKTPSPGTITLGGIYIQRFPREPTYR